MSNERYCAKCGRGPMGPAGNHKDHWVGSCPYDDPDCYQCENCGDHYTCDPPSEETR